MGPLGGAGHDIGKYSKAFQRRINDPDHAPRTDHSTAGAQEALRRGLAPAAYAIAGHHAGLPDGGSRTDTADDSTMVGRSKRQVPDCSSWRREVTLPQVSLPPFLGRDGFTDSFFTRMLYSCLVDADFLDTETFMQGPQPRGEYASLPVLLERLSAKTDGWLNAASGSALNRCRNDILRACMEHGAQWPRGLYTLTVPTGGGKTTGFSEEDLALLWEAILNMFETDHSAARGKMAVRKLIIFKHDTELGCAPAYKLFDTVQVSRKNPDAPARAYGDYAVTVDAAALPAGVTCTELA